ncbi:hypothetical protein GF402_11250 [Candidatus Fermentibacteria bacterium]|nr:hypothetical protein [Candidatus Fermentibacteria bacterium]
MRLVTIEELRELVGKQGKVCVSIHMPTTRAGADFDKNRIRFKTLLRQARNDLRKMGLDKTEVDDLMNPAAEMEDEHPFWKSQLDGLAVYLSDGFFRYYRLPFALEENAVVGEAFSTRPLIRMLVGVRRYFVLALGLGDNRLFEATPYDMEEISSKRLPSDISETLRFDVVERHLQAHSTSSGGGSGPRMLFHGHGSAKEDRNNEIRRYLSQVATGVSRLLSGEYNPLVVATLPHLLPRFREACEYPHLSAESVEVNPGHLSVSELHEKSWAAVEEVFSQAVDSALQKYGDAVSNGRATSEPDKVVIASADGRINTLLLAEDDGVFGRFNPSSREVEMHEQSLPGDVDLSGLAAEQTLLKDGNVLTAEQDRMPNRSRMAAILRY